KEWRLQRLGAVAEHGEERVDRRGVDVARRVVQSEWSRRGETRLGREVGEPVGAGEAVDAQELASRRRVRVVREKSRGCGVRVYPRRSGSCRPDGKPRGFPGGPRMESRTD